MKLMMSQRQMRMLSVYDHLARVDDIHGRSDCSMLLFMELSSGCVQCVVLLSNPFGDTNEALWSFVYSRYLCTVT